MSNHLTSMKSVALLLLHAAYNVR